MNNLAPTRIEEHEPDRKFRGQSGGWFQSEMRLPVGREQGTFVRSRGKKKTERQQTCESQTYATLH